MSDLRSASLCAVSARKNRLARIGPSISLTSRTLILKNGHMAVDGPRDTVLAHLAQTCTGSGGGA